MEMFGNVVAVVAVLIFFGWMGWNVVLAIRCRHLRHKVFAGVVISVSDEDIINGMLYGKSPVSFAIERTLKKFVAAAYVNNCTVGKCTQITLLGCDYSTTICVRLYDEVLINFTRNFNEDIVVRPFSFRLSSNNARESCS